MTTIRRFDDDMPPRPADILPDDDDDDWIDPRDRQGRRSGRNRASSRRRASEAERAHRARGAGLVHPSRRLPAPAVHLLAEPKKVVRDATLSADALEQNARMLEGVLEDFGVKGEIIHVRPARSSRSTNWSPRPASSRRASSASPTISPAR